MSGGLEASINEGGMHFTPHFCPIGQKCPGYGSFSDVALQVPIFLQASANW